MKYILKRILSKLGYSLNRLPTPAEIAHLAKFFPPETLRFDWLKNMRFQTVLDIGAHNGESATQFLALCSEAKIHSVEPIPDCVAELRRLHGSNPRVSIYPFAIGDEEGEQVFNLSAYSASSSLLNMSSRHKGAYPFSADATQQNVQVKTLDSLFSGQALPEPILVKIDTQGYEAKVIQGGKKVLRSAKAIIVETSFVELYEGQHLFMDIYAQLLDLGYQYFGSWDQFLDPQNGRPLQQDGIFLRMK